MAEAARTQMRLLPLGANGAGACRNSCLAPDHTRRRLYLSAKDSLGASLVFSTFNGHSRVLRSMIAPTLAVPSPDGKRLAFWEFTSNKNVWLEQQP
jgi:hypothetical protein